MVITPTSATLIVCVTDNQRLSIGGACGHNFISTEIDGDVVPRERDKGPTNANVMPAIHVHCIIDAAAGEPQQRLLAEVNRLPRNSWMEQVSN